MRQRQQKAPDIALHNACNSLDHETTCLSCTRPPLSLTSVHLHPRVPSLLLLFLNTHPSSPFHSLSSLSFLHGAHTVIQKPQTILSMADTRQDYYHYQHKPMYASESPSASQVLALAALLPLGAFLLLLAALTLAATVLGIAVSAPLFVIFSPVLLPAALLLGLAVAGLLTSGAFGVTALSSFTWLANYVRRSRLPEQLEYAKHRARETISQAAQSAKEAGEAVLSKVQESGQEMQTTAQETKNKTEGGKAREEKRSS
ncbi:oleosin Cor a 15-like [Prosopis cineraria]|uniref:oleosin Cor a 15-like n=1 Tax=Prosopis cineraria TaxID=364024 RepID=UPI00240FD411|nr:oleosin Cor a 15-like [Prosopis cineraria]